MSRDDWLGAGGVVLILLLALGMVAVSVHFSGSG